MRRFAQLFAELDATTSTNAKVDALQRYFAQAPAADAAWAVYFLAGGKPRQVVGMAVLAQLACRAAGIPGWLFDECHHAVGDLAETIALVLPPGRRPAQALGLAGWVEQRLLPLRGLDQAQIETRVAAYWDELDQTGRFLLTKLIGGGFRVGVSRLLVQRALAAHAGLDAKVVAQRMMGYTDAKVAPTPQRFQALVAGPGSDPGPQEEGQPYPFFLAHQLDAPAEVFASRLGPVGDWLVEWKYDGIRGQVVKRGGRVWVWSRGEELVTERFPEIVALAQALPDGTVLDGEIVVWQAPSPDAGAPGPDAIAGPWAGRPAPFALLQQRIGRKTLTKKVLADAPVTFIAYDLMEQDGVDVRALPQHERRRRLEALLRPTRVPLSPLETAGSWLEFAQRRERSRDLGVEGFMLKRREGAYGSGRQKKGWVSDPNSTDKLGSDPIYEWWKWKIDPMTVDCVLVYAQPGHGRRASIHTDYTFAVWNRAPAGPAEAQAAVEAIVARLPAAPEALQLVPFAKAYSGLTDEEFRQVDAIVRRSTVEKFGPVRSVRPSLVFELAFEGINRSGRHRSGIAVRFPRMLRIRPDKPLHEANTLQDLEALLRR